MQGRQGFGRDFAEHQHDQGHGDGGDQNAGLAQEVDGDDGRQRRRQNIDEIVAEQNDADQPIRPLQQPAGAQRGLVAGFGAVAQAVAVEGHQSGFGTGEKSGTANQQRQGDEQQPYMNIVQVVKTSVRVK